MLNLLIPETELWDEKTEEFYNIGRQELRLEHSLVSLSKWESKWCVPFLSTNNKTEEQILDYIKCMTLNKNVKPEIYSGLTIDNMRQIKAYIDAPMTATTFNNYEKKGGLNREVITAEILYYWMLTFHIPFECEKWHINRLITLIRVCSIKNAPPKKMSKNEIMRRNSSLNASRRKKLNTRG